MGELVELIVDKYDGSLKAEHGTGRNMAPFVEREWGAKATELMWRIKALADPDGVLAPGVVLSRDPEVHLRHLKSTPAIEDVANERVHRVRLLRAGLPEPLAHDDAAPADRAAPRDGAPARGRRRCSARSIEQYEYDGIQTCAADGTCRLACPVGIDTGKLVKHFRAREHSPRAERAALGVARRWASVELAARAGLRAGHATRGAPARAAAAALRAAVSHELVPEWPKSMPPPAPAELPATRRQDAAAVYLPACVNRIFGGTGASGFRCPPRWSPCRPVPARRCGSPPRRRATAAARPGTRRVIATARGSWPTGLSSRCGLGPSTGGCRSSWMRRRVRWAWLKMWWTT